MFGNRDNEDNRLYEVQDQQGNRKINPKTGRSLFEAHEAEEMESRGFIKRLFRL